MQPHESVSAFVPEDEEPEEVKFTDILWDWNNGRKDMAFRGAVDYDLSVFAEELVADKFVQERTKIEMLAYFLTECIA
jgi:hypothetical protein